MDSWPLERVSDSSAVLIKFSATGDIEWTKTYSTDLVFNQLLIESDNSLTVTGQSKTLNILLRHLAADGTEIWRQTYEKGAGRAVLRRNDGYVIAGQQLHTGFAMRTDENGFSRPQERNLDPHKGRIATDQIKIIASPSPYLFYDFENFITSPDDSLKNLFFSASPWLGALDQDSLLHLAADTYAASGHSDYRTGFSGGPAADFNRVWRITSDQVNALKEDWADNCVLDRPVPFDIYSWPAKGNPNFTYNLDFTKTTTDKSHLPAPFVDTNGDGSYNPADGDYPQIKGDQMAWWMLTDDTLHTRTNGRPFIVDMGISMYVYDCPVYATSERTLLVDLGIINRSQNTYHQMFAGLWADPNLYCEKTPLEGSLASSNAFYTYGRDTAAVNCPVADQIPNWVTAVSFVNQSLNKFICYNNGGGNPTPPSGTDDPGIDSEYFNYMQGKWRDGTVPTYNGQPLDLVFPDNPAEPTGNAMCTNNYYPLYHDRRMIGSHGPFNFAANDTFQLTIAFTYHPDVQEDCPDIFGTVKNDLDQLHNLVNSGALETPAHLPATVQLAPGQSTILDATVPDATAYEWSTGAATPTISVSQPGNYSVTITRVTGCTTTETVAIHGTAAVESFSSLEHFRLFPNPGNGQFSVDLEGAPREQIEFTLYNAIGQIQQIQNVDFSSGALRKTFDYSRLPAGIYTLRLRLGQETLFRKVVIQR